MPFEREVSVIIARGRDGATRAFDVTENVHEGGILRPARCRPPSRDELADEAVGIAARIAEALGHVGVLAVEMFVTAGRRPPAPVVNEIAPRVHNSGHWTERCGACSQFEQHIRADRRLAARRPDAPQRRGDDQPDRPGGRALAGAPRRGRTRGSISTARRETLPGRKMGHYTRIRPLGRAAETPVDCGFDRPMGLSANHARNSEQIRRGNCACRCSFATTMSTRR